MSEPRDRLNPDARPATPLYPFEQPPSLARLRLYPFFAETNERLLGKLQPNLAERDYAPGDVILRMGDYGDAAYYIASGRVEVRLSLEGTATAAPVSAPARRGVARFFRRPAAEAPSGSRGVTADGTVVLRDMPVEVKPGRPAPLGRGDMFGEMSALSRYPVSADVVATEPTTCLLIATAALRKMLAKPEFADFKKELDERYRARTLAAHLRRVDIFADLDLETINRLRDGAELLSFEPGNIIVQQGAEDAAFYLVRGGYVKVGLQSGGGDLAVTYLRKGDHAGEVSLLLNEPWPFSLAALEHVELVRIARRDFQEAVAPYPNVERALWEKAVQRLKERGYAARNPLSSQYLQMAMDTGLIHGESVLLIDLNRCTRCDDCVRACADTHGGEPKFIREGLKYRNWSIPTSCYQCTDPVCMIGCPTGAISRPIGTAEVLINKDTCIGCGVCSRRCPWDNIIPVPYQSRELGRQIDLATKCDQCFGRAAGPACVQMCPHDAAIRINFKDVETVIGTLSR